MILTYREAVDLGMAARLVAMLRKRALIEQLTHRMEAGHYYKQAKELGAAVARARAAQPQEASRD